MIARVDVGCWVVRADPTACGYLDAAGGSGGSGSWRLGRTYRNRLVATGDRLVVLLSGSRVPGVHGVGRVTGPARTSEGIEVLDLSIVRLGERFVTRAELRADPVLAGAEPLRVPLMSNPSYLDPAQTSRLAELLAGRIGRDELRDAGWDRPGLEPVS